MQQLSKTITIQFQITGNEKNATMMHIRVTIKVFHAIQLTKKSLKLSTLFEFYY